LTHTVGIDTLMAESNTSFQTFKLQLQSSPEKICMNFIYIWVRYCYTVRSTLQADSIHYQ